MYRKDKDMDLSTLAVDHGAGAAGGALAALVAKDLVSRFLGRKAKLEEKAEDKRDTLIGKLLVEVEGVRRSLDIWGERWTHAQIAASELKAKVDTHGDRIANLEISQATMSTRLDHLGEASDD